MLAGLTVLAGSSGQISLGQGAFMAVGAYTLCKLSGTDGWSVPSLAAPWSRPCSSGSRSAPPPAGCAGRTWPARRSRSRSACRRWPTGFPRAFGGENGLSVNPPTPPSWLGANFPLERWEAWIACAGALIVVFVLYNLTHSVGRSLRAVRDDEIAASLCGPARRAQADARVRRSARLRGARRRAAAVVLQLTSPGAFPLQLSLTLLAGVVIGGLGSLVGAVWGAALLVLLPNWTNDLANSFSLSTNVSPNLPIAIYGVVLIAAMLVWPSGHPGRHPRARAVGRPALASSAAEARRGSARAGEARRPGRSRGRAGEGPVGCRAAGVEDVAKTPSEGT